MNIALDAMGGDHAPEAIVAGGVEAARVYGVTVSLVGQPDVIEAELKKHVAGAIGAIARPRQRMGDHRQPLGEAIGDNDLIGLGRDPPLVEALG